MYSISLSESYNIIVDSSVLVLNACFFTVKLIVANKVISLKKYVSPVSLINSILLPDVLSHITSHLPIPDCSSLFENIISFLFLTTKISVS